MVLWGFFPGRDSVSLGRQAYWVWAPWKLIQVVSPVLIYCQFFFRHVHWQSVLRLWVISSDGGSCLNISRTAKLFGSLIFLILEVTWPPENNQNQASHLQSDHQPQSSHPLSYQLEFTAYQLIQLPASQHSNFTSTFEHFWINFQLKIFIIQIQLVHLNTKQSKFH